MLTKSERAIMELLWSTPDALSCSDIIDRIDDRLWESSYTYPLLRSLRQKGFVHFHLSDKRYPKRYRPAITKAQYIIYEYFGDHPSGKDIKEIIQSALEKVDNIEDLSAIELYVVSSKVKFKS